MIDNHKQISQAQWHTLVIPALGKLRQEDPCEVEGILGYSEFKVRLNYTMRTYLKKPEEYINK